MKEEVDETVGGLVVCRSDWVVSSRCHVRIHNISQSVTVNDRPHGLESKKKVMNIETSPLTCHGPICTKLEKNVKHERHDSEVKTNASYQSSIKHKFQIYG
jgi:hypothetical protein